MALGGYLTLTGTTQGPILGSVTQKGREGSIEVVSFFHEIVAPRDPASGRPTGKRMHKPFSITKPTDRSSPLLYSVLTNNENLKEVVLKLYRPSPTGMERHAFTVRLQNATISGIQLRMLNVRNPRHTRMPELEEVSFAYQRIEWTWVDGGITADDDWEIARQ
ncbi:MAG: Hcp family type VI secretion system effector [Polyangiaceae bacterium]